MASELRVDKIIPTTGIPTGGGGGIIQVVQTAKTDTWASDMATNYPNFEEVTGLNVSITPKFATSKLLVTASVNYNTQYWQGFGQLWRGIGGATRALLPTAVGAAAGNRVRFSFSSNQYHGDSTNSYQMYHGTVNYLDSPNTTQQVSYSIAMRSFSTSYEVYVNRNHNDRDEADYYGRGMSSITVMEVSA
tara:strand:- start:372 stop:941 length:570 start_codon:yes stop_codon:yes gene_type:complete